jgi:hypothetical protein
MPDFAFFRQGCCPLQGVEEYFRIGPPLNHLR